MAGVREGTAHTRPSRVDARMIGLRGGTLHTLTAAPRRPHPQSPPLRGTLLPYSERRRFMSAHDPFHARRQKIPVRGWGDGARAPLQTPAHRSPAGRAATHHARRDSLSLLLSLMCSASCARPGEFRACIDPSLRTELTPTSQPTASPRDLALLYLSNPAAVGFRSAIQSFACGARGLHRFGAQMQ